MQLQIIHYDAFRRHARNYLEPAVIYKWNLEQKNLFRKLQEGGKVAVAGDMRADTRGTFYLEIIISWSGVFWLSIMCYFGLTEPARHSKSQDWYRCDMGIYIFMFYLHFM